MKARIVVRNFDGSQDVEVIDNVTKVEKGAGALELQVTKKAESTTPGGLVLYQPKDVVAFVFIPWHRIESVKVD